MADLFEEVVADKVVVAKKNKLTGNGIRQYSDNPPRVEESQSPRVEKSQPPRVPDRLVVVCWQAIVESHEGLNRPMPPLPNYITQEQPENPHSNKDQNELQPNHSPKKQFLRQ